MCAPRALVLPSGVVTAHPSDAGEGIPAECTVLLSVMVWETSGSWINMYQHSVTYCDGGKMWSSCA